MSKPQRRSHQYRDHTGRHSAPHAAAEDYDDAEFRKDFSDYLWTLDAAFDDPEEDE